LDRHPGLPQAFLNGRGHLRTRPMGRSRDRRCALVDDVKAFRREHIRAEGRRDPDRLRAQVWIQIRSSTSSTRARQCPRQAKKPTTGQKATAKARPGRGLLRPKAGAVQEFRLWSAAYLEHRPIGLDVLATMLGLTRMLGADFLTPAEPAQESGV